MQAQQAPLVVAIVFLAILFADRLGGSTALARRVYQVSLGLVLALTIIALTNAFIRPPDIPFDQLSSADFLTNGTSDALDPAVLEDYANRASEATSVRSGAAIAALILGLAAMQRWRTTGLGIASGGLILALFSGSGGAACTNALYGGMVGLGITSEGRDIAQFLVLLVGTLALAAYGIYRWDNHPDAEPDPAPTAGL